MTEERKTDRNKKKEKGGVKERKRHYYYYNKLETSAPSTAQGHLRTSRLFPHRTGRSIPQDKSEQHYSLDSATEKKKE